MDEFTYKGERMSHWKYYLALIVEIVGIVIMSAGVCEIMVIGKFNPAPWLITVGSLIMSTGSFFFAKIVKWKEYIEE